MERHAKRKRSRRSNGQSMVEFALSIPYLMFILIAILFFGRYFLTAQVILHAAQEGAKVAARTPNLSDNNTRDAVRGFSTAGSGVNPNSVIYSALGAARLLSGPNGATGNLPPGSKVEILPYDPDANAAPSPVGTVDVHIEYPFQILGNVFTGPSKSVAIEFSANGTNKSFSFLNFTIKQDALAAWEVYQN